MIRIATFGAIWFVCTCMLANWDWERLRLRDDPSVIPKDRPGWRNVPGGYPDSMRVRRRWFRGRPPKNQSKKYRGEVYQSWYLNIATVGAWATWTVALGIEISRLGTE